ncbi:ABZJ_00895 family protein [Gymnodinialimonas sp. 57CJ19]|uniref:ABZJ_00895 family protein n=1 Tax=Gymnodinialimonas sp. 57CJ19 TaxID=3138498 RepID=UPI0031344E8F
MAKPLLYYVFRFIVSVIGMGALLFGAAYLLLRFAPNLAETLMTGPAMIGASTSIFVVPPFQVGQSFFRHEGRAMSGGEGWGLAAICSVIFTGAVVAGAYLGLSRNTEAWDRLLAENGDDLLLALVPMVGLAVVLMLLFKLFFWAAIRGQLKRAATAAE